jgi:hypothetical protein
MEPDGSFRHSQNPASKAALNLVNLAHSLTPYFSKMFHNIILSFKPNVPLFCSLFYAAVGGE